MTSQSSTTTTSITNKNVYFQNYASFVKIENRQKHTQIGNNDILAFRSKRKCNCNNKIPLSQDPERRFTFIRNTEIDASQQTRRKRNNQPPPAFCRDRHNCNIHLKIFSLFQRTIRLCLEYLRLPSVR